MFPFHLASKWNREFKCENRTKQGDPFEPSICCRRLGHGIKLLKARHFRVYSVPQTYHSLTASI